MHASCQGHFSSDFSACVLPWAVSERSCSPLNRGKNIPIKLPPKILAKSLKMNGIQSSFEVLNGCDMCFSPTSVSGEAADHRCLMLHVCGGASWDEKAEHLTSWKRKDSVGELASHPFFRGEVRAQVQEDQRQLLFHILYELVLFQPEGKKFWPPFIWWRQKKKRREQWGRTNRGNDVLIIDLPFANHNSVLSWRPCSVEVRVFCQLILFISLSSVPSLVPENRKQSVNGFCIDTSVAQCSHFRTGNNAWESAEVWPFSRTRTNCPSR